MASLLHGFEEPGDAQDIRLVVDTMPTLAWSAVPDVSAELHNQRWLDYTGLSAQQATGRFGARASVVEKARTASVSRHPRGSLGYARDRLFDSAPQALFHAIDL